MYASDEPINGDLELAIESVRLHHTDEPGAYRIEIITTRGEIVGMLTPCEGESAAVMTVGGAGGGSEGPAGGVYGRLALPLRDRGVTTLRLGYREPGIFGECVLDALAGLSFLKGIGASGVGVVGHSFGGAVAIKAAQLSDVAVAVVAMSSQLYGTRQVEQMRKPLLLVHGADDEVLASAASEDIYQRANEPKEIVVLPGTGHSLQQASEDVFDLLLDWLPRHVRRLPASN